MPPDDVATAIRRYLVDEVLHGDDSGLEADTPLIEEEVLDSVGIFGMVSFLEDTFSVEIDPEEVVAENFDSITAIEALVRRMQAGTGA